MNKYVFWSVSFVYSVVYFLFAYDAPKNLPTIVGGIFGGWFWLGLVSYVVTHFGKKRKDPSRNTIAFWVSTVLFGLAISGSSIFRTPDLPDYSHRNVQQRDNTFSMKADTGEDAVQYLRQTNALFALLIQKNTSFKTQLKQAMKSIRTNPTFVRKWNETHSFDTSDLESFPLLIEVLEKEFSKYMRFASDEDIYDMYQTEYAHLVKYNCKVFPLSEEDEKETIRVKIKLINNSANNPYKGKTISDVALEQAFKRVGFYYAQKGYEPEILMRFLEGDKTLSKAEQCLATKGFYESLLALPKATSAAVVRKISQ